MGDDSGFYYFTITVIFHNCKSNGNAFIIRIIYTDNYTLFNIWELFNDLSNVIRKQLK